MNKLLENYKRFFKEDSSGNSLSENKTMSAFKTAKSIHKELQAYAADLANERKPLLRNAFFTEYANDYDPEELELEWNSYWEDFCYSWLSLEEPV